MKLTQSHIAPLFFTLSLAGSASAFQAPTEQAFRNIAATRLGESPAELALDRIEGPVHLGDLGVELYVASLRSTNGEKTVVALDARGATMDLQTAIAADREIGRARRGKLTARMAEHLGQIGSEERTLCAIWIETPDVEDLRENHAFLTRELDRTGLLTREMAEQHELELAQAVGERVRPSHRAALERMSQLGLEIVPAADDIPLVFVRGNARELSALQAEPRVLSIDDASQEYTERLATAVPETRANQVWFAPGGSTGVGATVAVVEPGQICLTQPNIGVFLVRPGGVVSAHTTAVASCIAGRDPVARGMAPGARLLSACAADFTQGTTNVTAQMPGSVGAVSWAVANGAQIMNLSYGAPFPTNQVSSFDRYLDWVVRYQAKTVAIACGNSGAFAGDPGAGFNQVAVGSFAEGPNIGWAGETMAPFSSWQNPVTWVETPQIAAPGVSMSMYSCNPSTNNGYFNSGTSFSSPLVAGAAALCVSTAPILGGWPEPMRAVLMAGAWHNIEGATTLSSRDGAGGVDARAAWRIASRGSLGGFGFGTLTPTSFDVNGFVTAQTGFANVGQTVRVALSFDSTVSGGPNYASDSLLADLDLYVYSPTGALVATSTSGLQPFEVVQFTAPVSGNYTVRVRRFRFNGASEFYGTAFTTNADI